MGYPDLVRKQERRQRRKKHARSAPQLASLRLRDLNALFLARYGETLPNDDSGREDVQIVAHHLAWLGAYVQDRIRSWIELRAPWMTAGEVRDLIKEAVFKPKRWRADRLAWRLRLTAQDRAKLRITTIGAIDFGKGERTKRRRQMERDRKQAKRLAAGSVTRAEYEAKSLSKDPPWVVAGVSRATWYRRKRET